MRPSAKSCVCIAIAAAGVCAGASAAGRTDSHAYRVSLSPFVAPPTRTIGLIVKARISGGPQLRLLLDSGADSIVLNRRAAAKSGCTGEVDLDLVGPNAATVVKKARDVTVEIGDLALRNVPLLVAGGPIAEGIDGALPLAIFKDFLIRLNIPAKALELLPYPPKERPSAESLEALASNRLLFVKGTVNRTREGYFLLDTGASYSAISRTMARDLKFAEGLARPIPLHGGAGDLQALLLGTGIRFRFGRKELDPGPVIAMDFSVPSKYHNLDVAGIIGYPAVSESVLLVNYRDGLVRIDPR
jgi:hypothetical protein